MSSNDIAIVTVDLIRSWGLNESENVNGMKNVDLE